MTHSCLTFGLICDGRTGQKFFFLLFNDNDPRVRSRSPRSESNLHQDTNTIVQYTTYHNQIKHPSMQ